MRQLALSQDTTVSSQTPRYTSQTSSVPYKPFSWLEWTEIFARGMVDTADFIIVLFLHKDVDGEEVATLTKVGGCLLLCILGGLIGDLILAMIIGVFLTGLGVQDGMNAGGVIGAILLFVALSFVYIYHVGLRVEEKQLERYQESKRQRAEQSARW